jgi:hypothetical protein
LTLSYGQKIINIYLDYIKNNIRIIISVLVRMWEGSKSGRGGKLLLLLIKQINTFMEIKIYIYKNNGG